MVLISPLYVVWCWLRSRKKRCTGHLFFLNVRGPFWDTPAWFLHFYAPCAHNILSSSCRMMKMSTACPSQPCCSIYQSLTPYSSETKQTTSHVLLLVEWPILTSTSSPGELLTTIPDSKGFTFWPCEGSRTGQLGWAEKQGSSWSLGATGKSYGQRAWLTIQKLFETLNGKLTFMSK